MYVGRKQRGVPSAFTGRRVQAVKSVPIPTTSSARAPACSSTAGIVTCSTPIQSRGCSSAQSSPRGVPSGSAVSMTPWGYSYTALERSSPVARSTSTVRPDRVPKSTPRA